MPRRPEEGTPLPTGQVLTLGGNLLFKDEANTKSAPLEQRLEVYTESDGACRPGEQAGQWYTDCALGLAQRST